MIIGIVGNTDKSTAIELIPQFAEKLVNRKIDFFYDERLCDYVNIVNGNTLSVKEMGLKTDIIVVFGGDGTMLSTAALLGKTDVPLLGVKVGGLGFLAEIQHDEIDELIEELVSKQYETVERMLLDIQILTENKAQQYFALNDLVVEKGNVPKLVSIDVCLQEAALNTYRSDGLIISTPTGSTAYSLAAGGPLLMPTLDAIIVTPICPHSLTVKPIVLTDTSELTLKLTSDQDSAQVNVDGHTKLTIYPGDKIIVKKASHKIKWIHSPKRDFFKTLRAKLNWGLDSLNSIN